MQDRLRVNTPRGVGACWAMQYATRPPARGAPWQRQREQREQDERRREDPVGHEPPDRHVARLCAACRRRGRACGSERRAVAAGRRRGGGSCWTVLAGAAWVAGQSVGIPDRGLRMSWAAPRLRCGGGEGDAAGAAGERLEAWFDRMLDGQWAAGMRVSAASRLVSTLHGTGGLHALCR